MTIQCSAIMITNDRIQDQIFQNRHKLYPQAFIRDRKLSFCVVVGMLLRMAKQSLQITCNWLGDLLDVEPASKQAFSQARQKISAECFMELMDSGLETNYKLARHKGLWRGFRLIACDGSTLRLPESEELVETFGRWPTQSGQTESPPIARISEFSDMTNKLVLSGRIAPCMVSEEELAKEQLYEVVAKMRQFGQRKLLFVYDRGYPSEEFINQHLDLGVDFIFRLPKNFNGAIKQIYESGDSEAFLLKEQWPLLRVVQFDLSSGEREILLTSLRDEISYRPQALSEVYQGRWTSMEEGYKKQKITMQLENFSGKTALAIKQEYWATLTVANLIEMGCIEQEGYWIPGKLPKRQVNRSVIFGSMRDATIEVICQIISPQEYDRKFRAMVKRLMMKVRPGRTYSREGLKKPKYHHVYRRAC